MRLSLSLCDAVLITSSTKYFMLCWFEEINVKLLTLLECKMCFYQVDESRQIWKFSNLFYMISFFKRNCALLVDGFTQAAPT